MGNLMTNTKKRIAILTILCMMFTLMPSTVSAVNASDISGHWAQSTIQNWTDNNLIKGYPDGTFKPDNNITRAEFITLVNGAFGYTKTAPISFTDVGQNAWYASAIAVAVEAGYISGYPDGTMRPDNPISREEAATIIMKINKLMENVDAANKFTDASTLVWSKGAVGAVQFAGIMNGYPDGSFQPKNYIKRGEAVFALDKSLTFSKNNMIYDKVGTYGPATGDLQITGNVIVQVKGTVLQNMVISGDLIIDHNVGEGNVTLKNVTIKGETKIYGGGVNSIIVIDSTLGKVTVSKVDGEIRIVISGNTTVGVVTANSGVTLQESNLTGDNSGFQEIILDAEVGDTIIMIGSFTNVEINSPGLEIQMPKGTTIDNLTLNEKTEITGDGTVDNADINVSGVSFETEPTTMDVATGVTEPTIETPVVSSGGGGGGSATPADVQVSAINITGDAVVGATLTAAPTPENATGTYQWTICDTVDGIYTNIGTNSNTYVPVTGNAGKFIKVVFTASGNYTGSQTSVATASVANAAQDAPTGLAGVAPTSYGLSDGSITGTTILMEYKLSGGGSYTAVTGTSITVLAAGTYNVRYAAKTGYNAGTVEDVVVAEADAATLEELQAALANIDITTINITDDITSTAEFLISRSVQIYGNGFTVSSSDTSAFHIGGAADTSTNLNAVTIDLNNIKIVSTTANSYPKGIHITNLTNSTLVLDNIAIRGGVNMYAIYFRELSASNTVTIKDSNISGWAALYVFSNDSTYNITSSTFTGTNVNTGDSDGFATIAVQKRSGSTGGDKNKINVSDSFINAYSTNAAHVDQFLVDIGYGAKTNIVNLTNCKLTPVDGKKEFSLKSAGVSNTFAVDGTLLVTTSVTSVTVSPEVASLAEGEEKQLIATVIETGEIAQTITWASSYAGVSVDINGVVKVEANALVGDYNITATSTVDGTKSDTSVITVTVTAP